MSSVVVAAAAPAPPTSPAVSGSSSPVLLLAPTATAVLQAPPTVAPPTAVLTTPTPVFQALTALQLLSSSPSSSSVGGVIRRERERTSPYLLPRLPATTPSPSTPTTPSTFREKFTVQVAQSFVERVICETFPVTGSRFDKRMGLNAVLQDVGIDDFEMSVDRSKTWDVIRVILSKKRVCVHNGNKSSSGYYVRL
jgi:hypothetical protein